MCLCFQNVVNPLCTLPKTVHAVIYQNYTYKLTLTHTAASHVGQLIMCSISTRFNCSQCCEAERQRYGEEKKREKEMQQRTGSEITISGPWYRCIDRKLRIYSCIRANTHNCFSSHCVPEAVVLKEKQSLI